MHEGVWEPEAAPYIHLRRDGDRVIVSGVAEARFGHRIALPDGSLGGNWAEWRWDGRQLASPTIGSMPIRCTTPRRSTRWRSRPRSTHFSARGSIVALDLDGIAAFLAVGFYLGTDTPFAAIRSLPPAATLTWSPGGSSLASSPPSRPAQTLTRRQAIEGAADLVHEAVRRCIPDDDAYVLPLSGGRDSRHLLLELIEAGHPPSSCVTAHHHPHVWGGTCRTLRDSRPVLGCRTRRCDRGRSSQRNGARIGSPAMARTSTPGIAAWLLSSTVGSRTPTTA